MFLNDCVQSVLMRPQRMHSGLYAPICPLFYATVCKILYSISN